MKHYEVTVVFCAFPKPWIYEYMGYPKSIACKILCMDLQLGNAKLVSPFLIFMEQPLDHKIQFARFLLAMMIPQDVMPSSQDSWPFWYPVQIRV